MNRLRNSWIPLLAIAATAAIVLVLLRSDYEHGRVGPAIFPGIYPTTERFIPGLEGLSLAVEVVPAQPLAFRAERDRRRGLEIVPWDEVCIALEDHHPLTRSVAKGLAEDLTGYLATHDAPAATPADAAARLVIILPPDEFPKLPMAVRRVLRVRTVAPEGPVFMEGGIEQARELVVEVGQHDALGPAVDERTGMAPAGSVHERHVRIRARVDGVAPDAEWPRWHAAVGRGLAAAALRALWSGDRPPRPWDAPADRTAAVLARHHALPAQPELGWQDATPDPPHASVDRWYGVYQAPLVRGWGGAIVGTEVPVVKKGVVKPTIEVLAEVMGKGKWQPPEIEEDRWRWRADEDGQFEYAVATAADWGWRLAVMQRHPAQGAILDAWLTAAEAGDVLARNQLRRHLLAPGLPAAWRDRAAALLRQDPDAAEAALLAAREDASDGEREAAAALDWIRGIAQAPAPAAWPGRDAPEPEWNGRPVLLAAGEGAAVLTRDAAGRLLVWWRHRDGPPSYGEGDAALGSAGIDEPPSGDDGG